MHDGTVVTECAAICLYLADAFPQADLAPRPNQRTDCSGWMLFAAGPWERATMMQALGAEVPPDKTAMAVFGDFARTLGVLVKAVPDDGCLPEPKVSALDVYMGSQILWGVQLGQIPVSALVDADVARIQSRRGFIRANEADHAATAEFGPVV